MCLFQAYNQAFIHKKKVRDDAAVPALQTHGFLASGPAWKEARRAKLEARRAERAAL
jgi:hypothetical protein